MSPSNDLINEWLKVAEASPEPRFLTFAILAAEWGAKQEREACAKVCEDAISPYVTDSGGMKLVTLALAAAIRKRGEGKP